VRAVEGVTFAYRDGTVALRDLTLTLPRGRRTAILGANGSGKSTLVLHLDGIPKPQRGRVLLGGRPVGYDRAALNDLRRRVVLRAGAGTTSAATPGRGGRRSAAARPAGRRSGASP
jgi:ABC-type bacteriocin/lantibiotic exporter with double-glycine peptidase domain